MNNEADFKAEYYFSEKIINSGNMAKTSTLGILRFLLKAAHFCLFSSLFLYICKQLQATHLLFCIMFLNNVVNSTVEN